MGIWQTETRDGKRLILNVRRESTVLMETDPTSSRISELTFDYEGRLVGAFLDGRNYRRSLDNRILEKRRDAPPGLARPGPSGRLRHFLSREEVQEFETRAYAFVYALPARLAAPLPDEYAAALERIRGYSFARLEREREHFHHIYRPITVLPPDQYLALYLQVTEGCSYNECTFCGFYRDRRFHVKTPDEFHQHILAVRSFFGGGLSLRRTIFLGDANALLIPQPQLVAYFDLVNREFEILPRGLEDKARREWERAHPIHFRGIYSFVDAFTTRRKTEHDFAELAQRGLRRAYIGVESGDAAVLAFLGKPHRPEDVVQLVTRMKAGGVAVGIILLVGAGGKPYQDAHVRETVNLIHALPLDENDLIYLSELVDYPGSTYAERAAATGIPPLSPAEMDEQMAQLRAGLASRYLARGPKISFYDIREFVY